MKLYRNTAWKEIKFNLLSKNLPSDWEQLAIGDILIPNDKSKIKASDSKKVGTYPFFNCSENQTKYCDSFLVDGENIFITTGGDYMFNLYYKGKSAYSTDVWSVKVKDHDSKFVHYFLKNNFYENQTYFRGFKFKHLDKKGFKKMLIPIPSKNEQIAISSILSSQEEIISKTKNLILQIERRNKFMIDEILSGKLRVKEENGNLIVLQNADDNWKNVQINDEDILIPNDWSKSFFTNQFDEKPKSKITAKTGKKNGLYPFFNCSNKQTLMVDQFLLDEEILYFSTGGKPSILYNKGKSAYSTDVWAVSANKDYCNKFIYYYLSNNISILEKCFKGSGLKHLNKKDFLKMELHSIPIAEQLLMVKLIDSLILEKEKYKNILSQEEKTFNFLLEELMSGRLRVEI